MSKDINVLISDGELTVNPVNACVTKYLTIYVKELVIAQGKQTIQMRKKTVFRNNTTHPDTIHTMQGFCRGLCEYLKSNNYNVILHDLREDFPKPKLNLMHGFRYSQKELLTKFLLHDESGLCGAPTRYGKTTLMINTLRAYTGITTVVTAPGRDLVAQLYDDIKKALPHRDVVMLGAGSRKRYPSEDISVISMDSLELADFGRTKLLLIDEPHAAVTTKRLPVLNKFIHARRLGFGATLTGRFDNKDKLIEGLIGSVLEERTYTEAVAEGAICQLRVYMLKIPLKVKDVKTSNRQVAFKKLLFQSPRIAHIVAKICRELLPEDWQTLIFINNEKQADFFIRYIGEEGTIAMAKKMTNKSEREAVAEAMKGDEIKRCLASNIYAQGVTFNHVRAMINVAGGGNNTMTIQKPGRLAEVRPGKKMGVIFDLEFTPEDGVDESSYSRGVRMLFTDSRNRIKAYAEKGYDVIQVSTFSALKESFEADCI